METLELNTKSLCEIISREEKTLFKLPEAKVSVSFYWDAHGTAYPWEGPNGKKSMTISGKSIELRQMTLVRKWKYVEKPCEEEYWHLYVDGKKQDIGEITSYSVSGDRKSVRLRSCMGAG